EDSERQAELGHECPRVLGDVGVRPPGFDRQRMPEHFDSLDRLAAPGAALALRADHEHAVAGFGERGGLLPRTPIERYRQVLDDDQYAMSLCRGGPVPA